MGNDEAARAYLERHNSRHHRADVESLLTEDDGHRERR
jgi:hypothetical protein